MSKDYRGAELQYVIYGLHDTTGYQTALKTGWMFVYTIQPVVEPVVKPD